MTTSSRTGLSADQWRRVFAAADEALELPPAEREAVVARLSAENATLGAELRALLASGSGDSRLDTPAAATAAQLVATMTAATDAPATVGPYRLVSELGHGGMGAVYLAERADDQFRKRVAVKLLPFWSAADEHRVRRFIEERQILAALEHPDIARLLDGGVTPGGVPWFAMEYVEGIPIDQYGDENHLTIERRLELFRRVCAAVAYAHRNLIVHRDLKPGNILVSADGGVKLLDFGIAKLLGADATPTLTQTGDRVMTPLYASPEQIRGGPLSTASDIYSLGVLLCQLLVGRHPYRLASTQPHEVARAILEQEPERPSWLVSREKSVAERERAAAARGLSRARLVRRLQGDLDTIALTAMQKDPAQRYATVEQLADDVRRHLAGLPLVARRETRAARLGKFVRRHPVAVPVGALGALVAIAFGVITTVQATRLRAEAARVATERATAEQVLEQLRGLFTERPPATARELVDTAAARLHRSLVMNPAARARLMFEMALAYKQFDVTDRARRLADSAVAIQRTLAPDGSREVAEGLHLLGTLRLAEHDVVGAERAEAEALAIGRRLLGARSSNVARMLDGLSAVRQAEGRLDEAESLASEALAIDESRRGATRDMAESAKRVADVLFAKGEYAGARRRYEEALALTRQSSPEQQSAVAKGVMDLASAVQAAGDRNRADSLFRYGVGLYRQTSPGTVTVPALPIAAAPNETPVVVAPPTTPQPTIVFVSDRDGPDPTGDLGNQEVYVMNADGTAQKRLTFDVALDSRPVFSPDGKRIAFQSTRGGAMEVYLMNADGSHPVQLTHMSEQRLGAMRPTWSPDGKRIAFQTLVRNQLYAIDVDGTNLTRLTSDSTQGLWPAWSPDGRKIAFNTVVDGGQDIFIMNSDGTNTTRLTTSRGNDQIPSWSPDGAHIAFASQRDGNFEIYVMNADGTNQTRLTVNPDQDAAPTWSRDGKKIAFSHRVLGHMQVYVMNADGSGQTRLTPLSSVAFNGAPSWGPVVVAPSRAP